MCYRVFGFAIVTSVMLVGLAWLVKASGHNVTGILGVALVLGGSALINVCKSNRAVAVKTKESFDDNAINNAEQVAN